MSDQVEVAIIGMIQVVVLGILALLNNRKHGETQKQVEVVRKDVNDKMQQLVDSRHAEGISEGLRQAAGKQAESENKG